MYITFLTKPKEYQVTFEDIINNPFMRFNEIPKIERKKITAIESEESCKKLFNKIFSNAPATIPLKEDFKTEEHYYRFYKPKKSNPEELRPIDAPDPELKNYQTWCKTLIEDQLHFIPHKSAHGYVKERSIITNNQVHQENESYWYLAIDIKNFFNSINEEFIRRMLAQVYPFPFLNKTTIDSIIKASLLNGVLPQGSVLSPTLTNAIMVPIDFEIEQTLMNYKRHHYVYTRYADDILISCKEKFDPNEIIKVIKRIFSKHKVPFYIKKEKTKFTSRNGKNFHLGTIINKDNQISLGHEKNKRFRAMLFNFCTTGEHWEIASVYKMLGLISYYKSIEPEFVKKQLNRYNKKFNIDILTKAKNMIC